MKATIKEDLVVVAEELCAEQTEMLRIFRSHMDGLSLSKATLVSLILSVDEIPSSAHTCYDYTGYPVHCRNWLHS
jgi:hypothetical protein